MMKTMGRTLLVEADSGLRMLLQRIFKGRLLETEAVGTLEEILPLARREPFDFVLVNWTDAWNGQRDLLVQICAALPRRMIVSRLSGKTPFAVELLRAGACDCLTELTGFADLADAVERALDRHFLALADWRDQSVLAIAEAVGSGGPETEGQNRRVADTAVRLCQALGIRRETQLWSIRWGAFLRDVGKTGVPSRIWNKAGPLTPNEQHEIERHPQIGKTLLERIPFLENSLPLVLHHHERYDGGGYPAGWKGDRIPLEVSAVAVADSVAAMLCPRPYRAALPWHAVVSELRENQGRQFDPRVVRAALEQPDVIFQEYLKSPCLEGAAS